MQDRIAFAEYISAEFTENEQVEMFARQINEFVADGVDFLTSYTYAAGDGWI